jgi:hypothetical protein
MEMNGKVGNTTYSIVPANGGYRVFIWNIARAWEKTLIGAFGVVTRIGRVH